ncbi:hypothetical protein [Mesorhizobium sp. SP-1A]|uniref:hypothetical protein n=1 Tax=Mesorhizobium sp. SP-1A TaxID=3077840 RepID=UPI0028F72F71|nr:hypothetical protein [Mesorhizobium sp. SP-1A]
MQTISQLEDLNIFGGKDVTILVETDRENRAAKISIDGVDIHSGHLWEFHPGACGGWFYDLAMSYGGFSSVKMLVASLQNALSDLGASCELKVADGSQLIKEVVFEDAPAFTYTI